MRGRRGAAVVLSICLVAGCNGSSSSGGGGGAGSDAAETGVTRVAPVLSLDRNAGAAGVTLTVAGDGFDESSRVTVFMDSTQDVPLAESDVQGGAFSTTVLVPRDTISGSHQILAVGLALADGEEQASGQQAEAAFTVMFSESDFASFETRIFLRNRILEPDPEVDGLDGDFLASLLERDETTHAIVQLKCLPRNFRHELVDGTVRTVAADDVATLAELGIELLEYLNAPEGIGTAYLAAISSDLDVDAPILSDIVRAVVPYEADDKIQPGVLDGFAQEEPDGDGDDDGDGDGGDESRELAVSIFSDVAAADAESAVAESGASLLAQVGESLWLVAATESQVEALAAVDAVRSIEAAPPGFLPTIDEIRETTSANEVQGLDPETGAYSGLSGRGIRVAVMDTGIDRSHPDFAGRVLRMLEPQSQHGTAVAGVIGASGVQSDGSDAAGNENGGEPFQWRGMAPEVGLVPFEPAFAMASIYREAINGLGADVSNHSYVLEPLGRYSSEAAAVDTIASGRSALGIPARPMVWAVGNNALSRDSECGEGELRPQYPLDCGDAFQVGYFSVLAPAKNPIAVGSVEPGELTHSAFSSLGPTLDGRLKPEIVVPTGTITTTLGGPDADGMTPASGGYAEFEGTSLSAPVVSGGIALLLERYAEVFDVNINVEPPLPSTVKGLLIHSARDLIGTDPSINPDTESGVAYGAGPDWATGYGLLDLAAATELVDRQNFVEGELSFAQPTEIYSLPVPPGSQEVSVTLAWDDIAGSSVSSEVAPKLVNDLDLLLIDPEGNQYRPWTLPIPAPVDCDGDPSNGVQTGTCAGLEGPESDFFGPATRGQDRRNNVEQVRVVSEGGLVSGLWKVQVSVLHQDAICVRLPLGGSQSYSLIGVSQQDADVAISKTASPSSALAGTGLLYTVTVTNEGPDPAASVSFVDTLPEGVRYVTDTGDCSEATEGRLTCQVGDLDVGESRSVDIRVHVEDDVVAQAGGPTTIENRADVLSATPDEELDNNSVTLKTIVEESADLRVTKICKPDRPLLAGQTATCTIFVDNLGPSTARDVSLRDTFLSDGGFMIQSITSSQGECEELDADMSLDCQLGDIRSSSPSEGGRATVEIELTALRQMDITDVVEVTSSTPDPDTANNQAEDSIAVDSAANLAVEVASPEGPVVAGTSYEYTIELRNAGPSPATNVELEEALPPGITVVSVEPSEGGSCRRGTAGDPSDPTVCSFGTLEADETASVSVRAEVHPETLGLLDHDVRVSSETIDADNSDNSASFSVLVEAQADLAVEVLELPPPVIAGRPITYEIVVENQGPSAARAVELSHALTPFLEFVEATASDGRRCVLVHGDGGSVRCALGDLDVDEVVRVFVTVNVVPWAPRGLTIGTLASVSSATPDPESGNNMSSQAAQVETEADVRISVSAREDVGNPSKTFVLTVTVANFGPSDAQDVHVTNALPRSPDTKKVIYLFDTAECTIDSANVLSCSIGKLRPGESRSFEIYFQVRGNLGELTNHASVASSTPDPDLENNTSVRSVLAQGGAGRGL